MRQAECLGQLLGVVGMHFERNVDGRGVFILVLNFSFG